jgi:peptidoglycan/xylan/chitin deacetylase (PgdA/CDA1 family)
MPAGDIAARRVVLCYHSVSPAAHYASATPGQFADQLDALRDMCDIVSLDTLVSEHNASRRVRAALTFDDGYADNHEYALPLLAARHMPATFFVTAGFLERNPPVMVHLSAIWRTALDELSPLSWTQVADLLAAGMAIGSHTWSHPNLAVLPEALVTEEMRRSKEVIEDRAQSPVDAIAYPFGKPRHHVRAATFRIAAMTGYRNGYMSLPRAVRDSDDAYQVPRFGVGEDTVASLLAKVRGEIDWHATVHRRLPRRFSAALFAQYP